MPTPKYQIPVDPAIMNELVEANGEFSRDAGNCLIFKDPMKILEAFEAQDEISDFEVFIQEVQRG